MLLRTAYCLRVDESRPILDDVGVPSVRNNVKKENCVRAIRLFERNTA